MWDCGHLKVKQWPEDIVHLVCYRSRQKKVWYRICDLFAKTNLSLVYSANKNFKLTSLSPVEFSYETGPFGAMCGLCAVYVRLWCGLCAVYVRSLCGFGAVYARCLRGVCAILVRLWRGLCAILVRSLCYFGAVFVLLWCDFGAVFVLFWCDFSAVFVLFWCGVCAVFHIHRTYTAQIPEKGKRRGSVYVGCYINSFWLGRHIMSADCRTKTTK